MFGDLKDYINQRITLTKYEIIDSTSNMLAAGVFVLVIGFSVTFLILLGSIAIGFMLGHYFDNYGYGFLAVTGIYLLFKALCLIFRKNIKLFLANIAVENAMNALTNQEDDEDEE